MVQLIHELAYGHSRWRVFTDFVTLAACSISNTVDRSRFADREAEYLRIVSGYDPQKVTLFSKLLAHLALALEERPRDVLGELFMELDLGNKRAGQFFTPTHICELMGQIVVDDKIHRQVAERGFVTVQEPACGAGATVIGLANAM